MSLPLSHHCLGPPLGKVQYPYVSLIRFTVSHHCCLVVYPFWERLGELIPTENQELESRRCFGKRMPLRQPCWCPSSIDTRRSLGSTGHVEREGLLPGQQLVFRKPCPGCVAPLERRTLQRYSIVSCRRKDADDALITSKISL